MKRVLFSVIFLFLFSASAFSQSFEQALFSPLTGYFTPLPYSQVAFISPRVHSLGFHLYNVVPDTLTQLFLNPAQITLISKPKFYLNFEPSSQMEDAHSEFLAPSSNGLLQYKMNLPFDIGPSIKFYPYSNSNYFSVGIWNSVHNHPLGLFLRLSGYLATNDSENLLDGNFGNIGAIRKYYFAQIWFGLLQRKNVKIGLSYAISNKREQDERHFKNKSNRVDSQSYKYEGFGHRNLYKWLSYQKHTVHLGAYLKYKQWLVKPRIGFLLFQQKNSYYSDYYSFSNQKYLPDSERVYLKTTHSQYEDYSKKDPVAGGDLSLDLEKGNSVIFLYGFLGRNAPEEYYNFKNKFISVDRVHFQRNQTRTQTSYLDLTTRKNTIWHSQFRLGVGRRFYFFRHVKGYISIFGERAGFHKALPFSGGRIEYVATVEDTNLTQSPIHPTTDLEQTFLRLGLPVGIEMRRGMFSFRMGIEENYLWQKERILLSGTAKYNPFSYDFMRKHILRNYYLGLGINKENLTLDIRFDSEIIQYKLWNIAFIYNW